MGKHRLHRRAFVEMQLARGWMSVVNIGCNEAVRMVGKMGTIGVWVRRLSLGPAHHSLSASSIRHALRVRCPADQGVSSAGTDLARVVRELGIYAWAPRGAASRGGLSVLAELHAAFGSRNGATRNWHPIGTGQRGRSRDREV
jgi:hypothetical protein